MKAISRKSIPMQKRKKTFIPPDTTSTNGHTVTKQIPLKEIGSPGCAMMQSLGSASLPILAFPRQRLINEKLLHLHTSYGNRRLRHIAENFVPNPIKSH